MPHDVLAAHLSAHDATTVIDAIEELGERLRRRDVDDAELGAVADELARVAAHPSYLVRKAVAHALRYLRHASFHGTLGVLLRDENAFVKGAAERTLEQRTERTRMSLLAVDYDEQAERVLAELEKRHSRGARRAAVRVAQSFTEYLIRELHHEVKNAVTPLSMTLLTVEQALSQPDFDRARLLEHIRTARGRLRRIGAILEAARDYVTTRAPEYAPENARRLVEEAVTAVGALPLARANGFEAHVEVDAALVLDAHGARLVQALTNILKNAVEASVDRSPIQVWITARRVRGSIELTLRDAGCGMDLADPDEIWRPFRSKKPGGNGLGMPVVKKIVDAEHGGEVQVKSAPGEGTTVCIRLPIKQKV